MAKSTESIVESKQRTSPIKFLVESWQETKRVRWPNRKELVSYTTATLVLSAVLGLLVWGFDLGVAKLMSLINLL